MFISFNLLSTVLLYFPIACRVPKVTSGTWERLEASGKDRTNRNHRTKGLSRNHRTCGKQMHQFLVLFTCLTFSLIFHIFVTVVSMKFATHYNTFDFLALSQGGSRRMGMQGDPGISGYEVSANTSHDHISTLQLILTSCADLSTQVH